MFPYWPVFAKGVGRAAVTCYIFNLFIHPSSFTLVIQLFIALSLHVSYVAEPETSSVAHVT